MSARLFGRRAARATRPARPRRRRGERLTVLAFAAAVLLLIVGAAFALGYILGKLLL